MSTLARPQLSPEEVLRYGRHLSMPEVGLEGQRRLKAASVVVVGAGGLGSPIALYLAAAGVGRLGIVEHDTVDASNLQRQLLYGTSDVGASKLAVARRRLAEVNPHVEVVGHELRLDSGNALDVLGGYDVVVDGSDNFATRYLVNDACLALGKPDVWGAILRFEGQVSVFWGERGPCYRCLFPEPPPLGSVPSCAEAGVLGVLPGIIGAIQASEAIKLILGVGEPLVGRFVVFDALRFRLRELELPKSPSCPGCSAGATIELRDETVACDLDQGGSAVEEDRWEITVGELAEWRQEGRSFTLLDVREPHEDALCRIEGRVLLPIRQIPERHEELDPLSPIVVYCHHGPRSLQVVAWLRQQGYGRVMNLAGGIDAWSRQVDPSVPRY